MVRGLKSRSIRRCTGGRAADPTAVPVITDLSSMRFVRLGEPSGAEDLNKAFIERYRAEKNRLRLGGRADALVLADPKIIFLTSRAIGGHRNPGTGGR